MGETIESLKVAEKNTLYLGKAVCSLLKVVQLKQPLKVFEKTTLYWGKFFATFYRWLKQPLKVAEKNTIYWGKVTVSGTF